MVWAKYSLFNALDPLGYEYPINPTEDLET